MALVKWIPFFLASAALETATQVFLKKGADVHSRTGGVRYYIKLLRNRWVVGGILLYLVEMAIWIVLLANIPLSIAFPFTGIQKIFMIAVAVLIFREKVTGTEWLGIATISAGILLIISSP
ncbi:MAG: hypothetical protein M0024_14105 [Nitrospiraceae bacterium]|nr:hypothetical protein [Nitrospiraceae bacterium]